MRSLHKQLADDFRYCHQIVCQNRDNFPVGSPLIPHRLRRHLHAVYAFARTADEFADLPGRTSEERLALLNNWSRRLERSVQQQPPDHPIFRALSHTLSATELPPEYLFDLLTAFRMDLTQKRYASLRDLESAYCRYSANPIGRIVLHLAGENSPENLNCSDAICTALQLVNHWQDLGEDIWRGSPLYLPLEEMARFEVSEEQVLARRFSPALGSLMLYLTDHSRTLFNQGTPLLHRVRGRIGLELTIIWEAGMALLDRIDDIGGNTLGERPRLTRNAWATVIWRALRSRTIHS